MKRIFLILSIVFALVGCTTDTAPDYRNDDYGYVQFKLYKEASYGTRAVKPTLDYLAEACKVKVTLGYEGTTIAQSLTLTSADGNAEMGLRSDKLQLLIGKYDLVAFALYDTADELLYTGAPAAPTSFEVISGGLTMQDITVNVVERGSVRFTLKKDIEDSLKETNVSLLWDKIIENATVISLPTEQVDILYNQFVAEIQSYADYSEYYFGAKYDFDGVLKYFGFANKDELRNYAEEVIEGDIVYYAVIQAENLSATDEEYRALLDTIIEQTGKPEDEVLKIYTEDYIRKQIVLNKLDDHIYDLNTFVLKAE